jgi:predicted nucleotidyltransferase
MVRIRLRKEIKVEEIKEKIKNYFKNKKKVKKVILFGSLARGDYTIRSDIDLVVIMDTEENFIYRGKDFQADLNTIFPLDVELFVYTPSEWERMKDSFFRKK